MLKNIICCGAFTLLSLISFDSIAQTVSGFVYDADGRRVSSARVMLMRDYVKQKEMWSDNRGEFRFTDLPQGRYELQVKKDRFSLFQQTVVLENHPQHVYVVLPLARQSDAVQVNAIGRQRTHERDAPASKTRGEGGQVDPAELLQPLRPVYPIASKNRGIEGAVVVFATISTSGSVENPVVIESPDPDLEQEALRSARELLYRPMRLNGHPVPCQVTILFDFKLGES